MSRFEGSDGSVPVRHLKFMQAHREERSPQNQEKNSCLLRVEEAAVLSGGRSATAGADSEPRGNPSCPQRRGGRSLRPPGCEPKAGRCTPEPPAPADPLARRE